MNKKQICMIIFMLLPLLFFGQRSVQAYNTKKEKIFVEGVHTSFSEILSEKDKMFSKYEHYKVHHAKTENVDLYLEFLNKLYYSEIIGINPDDARELNYPSRMPFFSDNMGDGTNRPEAFSSRTNPMIRQIEFYEYCNDIYIKIWYSTDRRGSGYTVAYKLEKNAEKEFLEAYTKAKAEGRFEAESE